MNYIIPTRNVIVLLCSRTISMDKKIISINQKHFSEEWLLSEIIAR